MSNQRWLPRAPSSVGKVDGKSQSFRGKLEFGSPVFRIAIGTVVLLSLMTPVFWISTGTHWNLADDLEKLGGTAHALGAIIPNAGSQSVVDEEFSPTKPMATDVPRSVRGEKQVTPDNGNGGSDIVDKQTTSKSDNKSAVKRRSSGREEARAAGDMGMSDLLERKKSSEVKHGGGGGRVALEAAGGSDRAGLEKRKLSRDEENVARDRQKEEIEEDGKSQVEEDLWLTVKRHKARPERFWEAKIGATVEAGKGLPEYAMNHGHETLAKSLKEHMDKCLTIRYEYKRGGDWPGEANTLNFIRVLEIQVVRAREYKSNMQIIVKMKKDIEAVKEKVLSLQRERNILDLAAAKALPRGLHCLSMRLTVEHNSNPKVRERLQEGRRPELDDPSLYHYALFSDNILAAAVVVNSTVTNALEPEKHVFHVVTDSMNRNSFDTWFTLHPPRTATIEVQSVEDFKFLNSTYCPVLQQLSSQNMKSYYFAAASNNQNSRSDSDGKTLPADIKGAKQAKYRNPKYLSMLNHLRFYLPEMYPNLDKILFLDDDIVVQKDLTGLWKVDLHGNVNGAVFTCVEDSDFHRLHKYLNFSHPLIAEKFDPQSCGWAYGMNVFDLDAWREADLTSVYHHWQRQNHDRSLWRLGTLPPGLLTFYNLTQPLDKWWHVLGLGYNPSIDVDDVNTASVVHYNGNQKPWLDIAMKHFRGYWSKYIASGDEFIQACNLGVQ